MRPLLGAVLGAGFAGGALLVARAVTGHRRMSLAVRLDPYVNATPVVPAATPVTERLSRALARMLGAHDQTERRLAAAAWPGTVADFRLRQARWWVVGATAWTCIVGVLALAGSEVSVGGGLASAALLGTAGPLLLESRLRSDAARRRLAIEVELPAVAGLLSIALTAGETIHSALTRTATVAGGVLGGEISGVLEEVRTGSSLSDALERVALRLDVPSAARLFDALRLAGERGVPVAGVLRALAGDLRAAATRRLLEAAGRRQVLMLLPVVFLILPVCVLFAFYPALHSLRMLSA